MSDVPQQPSGDEPTGTAPAETRRPTPPVLWVLAVLGGFLALAALWYAIFGAPQRIGPDLGLPGGVTLTPTSTVATTETPVGSLTAEDVRGVLSAIDYPESEDTSSTEYRHAVQRMLAYVDLTGFARRTLDAAVSIEFTDPGAAAPRRVTGPEKQRIVDESLVYWARLRDPATSTPDAVPLDATIAVKLYPPLASSRNLRDSLFEVVAQGLHPLGLMFGAQDVDNEWSWRIESVSVTGTDTADVTYSASVRSDQGWSFVDPGARYVKKLVFSASPGGGWKLAGFTNFAEVERQFRDNQSNPGAATPDEWWSAF